MKVKANTSELKARLSEYGYSNIEVEMLSDGNRLSMVKPDVLIIPQREMDELDNFIIELYHTKILGTCVTPDEFLKLAK